VPHHITAKHSACLYNKVIRLFVRSVLHRAHMEIIEEAEQWNYLRLRLNVSGVVKADNVVWIHPFH